MSLPCQGWLDRPCPPAISSDTAVALAGQEKHLILKGVRVEAIRVVKDNGLPFPPILKIEFCAVFRGDGAHRIPLIVAIRLIDCTVIPSPDSDG
jgi:hypothetical protein